MRQLRLLIVCHLSLLLAGSNTATTHYPYSQQKVKLLYLFGIERDTVGKRYFDMKNGDIAKASYQMRK
jgi:hypothetical protein